MYAAEEHLGIPRIIDPRRLVVEKPDEQTVMSYLSYFCCPNSPGQKALLEWVNQVIPDHNVSNFSSDWIDGRALGALINVISEGGFPEHQQMNAQEGLANCKRSMDAAESLLKVRKTLQPEEFTDLPFHQLARMSYVTQLYLTKQAQSQGLSLPTALIPTAPHNVEITNVHIPDEPGTGTKLMWVELDCSQAGSGVVTGEAKGEIAGTIDAEVEDIGLDQYRVRFPLVQADIYRMSVHYGDGHITGSPFSINLLPPDADRVQLLSTSTAEETGGPVALSFNVAEAGQGKLTAKALTESGDIVPVEVKENLDGTFKVLLSPQEPDVYIVDVNWGRFSVEGADKRGDPLSVAVEKDPNSDYKVSFGLPGLRTDTYKVTVLWEGKPVPGSPFQINLLPPALPEKVEIGMPLFTNIGEPVDIAIDTSSAGSGEVIASCVGEQCGRVPVKIAGPSRKPYQVSFVPPYPDIYTLSVLYDDSHIRDSPFTIDLRPGMMPIPEEPEEPEEEDILDGLLESVLDLEPSSKIPISEEPIELAPESVEEASPPGLPISEEPVEWVPESVEESLPPGIDVDPSKCKITGQENLKGLLLANQPVSLKVDAREAGKGVLEVIPQGPKGSQEPPLLEVTPNPEEPQIYDVTFVPTVHGKYTMQFLWSSYPIPDSPVEFKATDISAVPASLHGKPIGLDLDSEAKPSDLKAYAIHEDTNAQFKVKISKAQKGKLKLTFQPKEPGIYRLHVLSKDKDIRGSPFIVRYGKPPKADACKVEGIGKKYYIGEPLSFTINATEAGSGELVVRPTGPKGKKEKSEFSVNDNQDGTYRIEYTPINTGEHAFAFTWGGKTIPGCPYYVTVVERTPEIEPVSTDVYLIDRMGAPSERQRKVQPAPEELGTSLGTALLLRITARGEEQRKAELIASATGERTGSAEVTIYRKSDSTSEVLFKPTEPDRYTIDVKLDGSDVPKCPLVASFAVAVSDPSKCLIVDLDKIPSPQQVGKDIPFRVDATAAGPGELKVSVDGPASTVDESPNLEVYPSREEPHMYHVRYVPTAPGTHNLHLKWEDEVIPGSPLSYEVNDIEEVQHGQPMGMDFSADCKIGDLDAYAIHEDTNTKHKVKIIKVQKGRFKLALQANHPGVYAIHVLLKHKEITGSPFRIRYGKQSHPENVRVTELPNQGYVDKPFTFKVDAKQAGSGELGVRGVGPTSGEKPKLAITDGKDRTFSVDYISNAPGDHQFHITWGGETVPGSPFEVPVIEPPEFEYKAAVYEEEPSLVTLTGRPLESELLPPELRGEEERKPTEMTIMVGKALRVKIRPQDEEQRKGGLVATAEGDKNGSTDVQVKQTPDGSFEVLFNPSSPDRYTIDMKINNEPVPKTPIIANYILPTIDASKCELLGIEDIPIPIKVNQEIHFQVNSKEAGPGALGINVSPPRAQPQPKIEARPSKEEPRIFDVYYTPPTAGLHKLSLTWEKESIPGSPLNFVVKDEVSIEDAFASLLEALPPKIEWKEPAVTKVGQPLELPLDITTTEQGSITAKCMGEECGEVPVEIIAESPTKYKVSFIPQLDDLYTLQVFQNDKELQGSPYEIDLRRKRTISFVEEVGQVLETVEESAPPLPYFEEPPKEEEPAIVEAEPVTESRPMEEITNYVGTALVVKVRPQNEEQKEGDLVVSAIGERTGSVDAKVSRTSDDKFEIVFNPTEPDRYTIEAKMNDEHIPRSPFVVNYIVPPPDPSKCKLIGLEDLPGIPEVDCEIPLKVDTRKAGDGILDVTVDGPTRDQEPPKLDVKPSEDDPRVFHVNYIPTAPGSHTLNFQWSDTHIPDSPVKLVVVDMSTVETHLFGRPVGIDVDADCKVGELRAYALHKGTRTQLKVKAARIQKGKYKLTFQPKGAGLYYVHVFAKDKEVDRSPFLIRIAEPPKPEAVKVEGLTDKGYVEEPVSFTVDAREAGGGELNVRASGPGGKERGTLTVNDNKDSTYSVEYTPSSQGRHQLQITWAGKPVTDSPFPFLVKERSEEDLRVRLSLVDRTGAQSTLEPPEASATTDKDVLITIKAQTEEQKKATITASATGERVGSADVQISKPSEGVFEVLFHPPGPDRYAIEAKLEDELVPLTPVIVNYTVPPTDASLIQIVGLDNIPAVLQVNREIPFKADARLAGDGKLDVVVEAPQEEKDPPNLEVNEREPYIYDVSYIPTVPGSHTLKLTWGEEAIPLNFDVSSVQLFPYGKPIAMDIGTEGKAGDLESHAIHEDTGNRYKVKISKAQKGRFKLNFNPKETGLYAVHVFHKKNEIPGSPFHVRYDKPSHPENVRVTELPDQGYVDKPFTFKVDAKQAGSGELGVRGVGPTSGEKPKLAITDGKDRTFSVDYIPNAPGDHQFHITWGGETVPGSPFEIPVIESPEFEYKAAVYEEEPSLVTLTGRPLESELLPPELRGEEEERKPTEMTILVGKALRVKIRPHDEEQRKGGLVATAEGDRNGSTDVQVKETPDGSFEVLFNPSSPDRYTIDMKINNEPVPKTPIIANYILPPIDASKCKLLRIEDIPIPIKVNQEIYFQVDSREAGPGALGINVSPPHAQPQPKIEARPSKEEPRIFDVYYTPPTAGLHKLRLTWEKESIPGSPLNFVVEEEVSIEDAFASLLEALPPKIEWKEPAVSKVGQPLELPLDITTTEQGSITAKCTGEECGEIPVEIITESPTKYKVSFTPQLDDLYTLQVFQNDKELQGSPCEIDLRRKRTISFVEEVGQVLETVEESAPPLPYFEELPKEEEPAIVEAEPVTESRPMEELTNYVGRALVVKVRPQNEEQKEGDLVVSAIGERTGSVDATVSKTSDDKFEIVFNPTEPDRYTIEAKLNDEHIPRSPFVVNYIAPPPDPSKCKLIGLEDLPGIPEVDCEIPLKVDTRKAGDGILDVTVDGPTRDQEPPKLDVKPSEDDPRVFHVNYIPTAPGSHTLNFQWSDTHIPDSPVKLVVVDMSTVETHLFGRPVGIDVDADCKVGELRAYALHKGTRTQLKVKAARVQKGKYKLTFQPKGAGLYYVHVFAKDKEVDRSPFLIRIAEPPKPEAVKVEGLTDKGYVEEPVNFTVDAREAGGGELNVRASGPGGKERGTLTVNDNKDSTYSVEYTPSSQGKHQFQITWVGKPVTGSPFPFLVKERSEEDLRVRLSLVDRMGAQSALEPPEASATTDKDVLITIKAQTEEQKKATITASATGERVGSADVQISKPSEGVFEVLFHPPGPDRYAIEAKLDDELVPSTPVIVNYMVPPTDASLIQIVGLDNIPAVLQVNREIPFKADARLAGDGKLDVVVEAPQEEKDPPNLEVNEREPYIYDVSYVPTVPGSHTLKLTWGEEAIPLNFDVSSVQLFPYGKPITMDIGTEGKAGDLESHAIHEDTGNRYKVKISKAQKGRFKLNFNPKETGLYAVHVFHKKNEIPGSPFRIRYGKQSHPENVRVTELPDQGYVDKPFTFKVDAKQAGSGELGVRGVGPTSGEKPNLAITDGKDRTFSVDYIPNAPGDHQFHITWGGETVPGSPFEVPVIEPPEFEYKAAVYEEEPSLVTLTGRPLESELLPPELRGEEERKPMEMTIMVGKALRVKIRPQDEEQRKGGLVATAEGDKNGSTDVQVKQTPDGSFEVLFNPSSPDRYTIDMKINNEPVPKTPIIANYILPPIDASKCKLLRIEDIPIPIKVNQEIYFQVDSREAGPGALGINVSPPHAQPQPKIEARPSKEEPRIFDVYYTPPTAGLHKLRLTWEKESIPGSPLNFVVEEEVSIEDAFASLLEALPPKIEWKEPAVSKVGQPLELPLDITTTEQGSITAKCTGEECGEVPVEIIAESPTKYKVSFTPQLDDLYTLQVFQNDKELQGSPYEIDLRRKRTISFVEEVGQVLETVEESAPPLPYFEEPPKEEEPAIVEAEPVTESRPMEELTNYVGRALVVKVRPQNEEQKEGDLVVSAIGERTGSVDAKVSRTSDDKFEIVFNPTEPDRYTIEAKLNDEHIPRSPFVVNYIVPPPDPSKCKLIGLKDLPGIPEVDCEILLKVDTRMAGDGILDVTVDGPTRDQEPPKLEVKPSEDDPRVFHVNYIPTAPGSHTLNFQWSDTHIPDSPVKLVVVDMSTVETHLFGRPVGIDVDADCKVGELRAYALHEGTRTQLKVKAARVQKGKYKLTFQPKGAGLYYVHVFAKDKEVDRSPFLIRIAEPPKPEAVKVEGLTDKGYVEEPVNFTVDAREAGGGELNVRASGPGGKERGTLTVNDNKDSTYSVEYTPSSQGKHQLQITWAGKPVTGSPFPFLVKERSEEDLRVRLSLVDRTGAQSALEPPEASATTDKDVLITIKAQTEEQKKATITASATGERVGSADVQISKPSEGVFEVLFHPPGPDRYAIEAKLDDELVPSTPVIVNYTVPPTDASLIQIVGLDNIPAVLQVNREIPFKADARLAGDGKLDVVVEAPQEEKDPPNLEVNEREPYIYDVSYVPTVPGSHTLKLTWGEEAIPLNFDVSSVQLFPYGKPITMDIGTEGKAGDLESHAIHEDTGNRYKVKISKAQKGRFKLNFNPKEPGLYAVHVFHKKNEIPGSPFHVRYSMPTNPQACVVRGLSDASYIFEPLNFVVDASDAGTGELGFKVSGPAEIRDDQFTVTNGKDSGVYTATFAPNTLGEHHFNFTWASKAIPGSPFSVNVLKRKPLIKKPLVGNVNLVQLDQPVVILITNIGKDEDENFLTAHATGLEAGAADIAVEKIDEGTSLVKFTAKTPDDYTIEVKLNNEHIEGSPFYIKAVEKVSIAKGFVHPEGVCHSDVEAGQLVNLIAQVQDAKAASDLAVTTEGPEGTYETSVNNEVEGTFGFSFLPTVPGDYLVHVKAQDGEEVPGSPYKITVFEKEPEALKCFLPEADLLLIEKPLQAGKQISFHVNTREAGEGRLRVTSEGPERAEITVTDQQDGTQYCQFAPQVAGSYQLSAVWDNHHIQGSPFSLLVKEPPTVIGLSLENEKFQIGIPHHFKVDCGEVGDGILEVASTPSSAADIRVTPTVEASSYVCLVLPKEVGEHEIAVRYNGVHIRGSPFQVSFTPTSVANLGFSFVAEGMETQDVTATVESKATEEQIPSAISELFGGKYNLEFTPSQGLEYMVTIKCVVKLKTEEQQVRGSPFKLAFAEDASQCFARGEGLECAEVGKWNKFSVNTENAGQGELKVEIEGGGENPEVVISATSEHEYEVSYFPLNVGSYKLSISWGGKHIPGSPLEIQCTKQGDSTTAAKFILSQMPVQVQHGMPIEFVVNAQGVSGGGQLVVRAERESGQSITGNVKEDSAGSYNCSIEATEPGSYSIDLYWNESKIFESPVIVNVLPPPAPENVRVYGPGVENGYVGQEGNFTIDTTSACSGTLAVQVEGPQGGFKINLDRHPENNRVIIAKYDPTHSGEYSIQITWSGVQVPGSPFQVAITEPEDK